MQLYALKQSKDKYDAWATQKPSNTSFILKLSSQWSVDQYVEIKHKFQPLIESITILNKNPQFCQEHMNPKFSIPHKSNGWLTNNFKDHVLNKNKYET